MNAQVVYSTITHDCMLIIENIGLPAGDHILLACENTDLTQIGNASNVSAEQFKRFRDSLSENRHDRQEGDRFGQKLAFYFGQLCRQGTQKALGYIPSEEAGTYLDAFVLRRRYLVSEKVQANTLSLVMRALIKKAIIKMHTFKPGYEDIWTWLRRFYAVRTAFDEKIGMLTAITCMPQADKEKAYLDGFYNERDLLIVVAEKLAAGEAVSKTEITDALDMPQSSLYGKALQESLASVIRGWALIA